MESDRKIIIAGDAEMTAELLAECIERHKKMQGRYKRLHEMYSGKHPILVQRNKEPFKPDNRLVVNFAKYIVDTINGYFMGVPVKTTHDDETIAEQIEFIQQYNNQDDVNAELSKLCSIFGHAYELLFVDEEAQVGVTFVDPRQAFVVYDDSIVSRPLFGVRYFKNTENKIEGTYSDAFHIHYFIETDDGYVVTETVPHFFDGVPLIEYVENEERMGAFEQVETLVNAYNKAISEKANDVDYYADAYLKVLGAELEDKTLTTLRDNRIINMSGMDSDKIVVEFLAKPEADTTQENLINRIERLIYQMSMVANINDENFGTSSGIAMRYKLQSMSNMANVKERKFTAGMNRRWRMIMSLPNIHVDADAWMGLNYQFTRNLPANILEEAQVAGQLSGIVSEQTQLKVLSIVDNVKEEMDRKEEEAESRALPYGFEESHGTQEEEESLMDEDADA
ncbi:MAG: phage portal protein [Eubacteriales bacterium]|nr:phage portal protein [Eubacteriales bacterium]